MFNPAPVGAFDNTRDEYIEIRNNSSQTVPLYDPAFPANTWRIRGGADFDFPEGVSIAPGGMLLVVNFEAEFEPWTAADFRARFSVPANVPLFGPLKGKLSNDGERISLQRPDAPQPLEPVTVPYIVVDEFTYRGPALAQAAGTGRSLHRLADSWADEPANWTAQNPTPGVYPVTSSDADNDGLPGAWESANGLNDGDASGANGANGDPDRDGLTNIQEYQLGTHPNDAGSALRFSAVSKTGATTLSFTAAADRTYSVLYASDLAAQAWSKLSDVPTGPARTVQVNDPAPSNTTRFYRIVSPAQ
jgi:hypothetical protein